MKRRDILCAASAWLTLAPAALVFAQEKKAPVLIGWLNISNPRFLSRHLRAFKEGLAALGWKEGSDYRLEERWAESRVERLDLLAAELAAEKPVIVVAATSVAVGAATKAMPMTPIVQASGDPVAAGLVTNLARPGGMITGLSNVNVDLTDKLLELLRECMPQLRRVGILIDSAALVSGASRQAMKRSVERHRVDAIFAEVSRPTEIAPALSRLASERAQALIVLSSGWLGSEAPGMIKVARAQRWPVVASVDGFVEQGGLFNYGSDRVASYRRAATYVDKILKGAKPGDLPIEQPTKFELVLNLKTAKALGIAIPQSVLLRADRVIE